MGQALSRKRTFSPGASASPNGEIPTLKSQTNGTTSKETDSNVVIIETTDKSNTSVSSKVDSALSPNITVTSSDANTTVTSDTMNTTTSANLSASTSTNEGSPTKKEKRKVRKLFTFSLKRSRPGSGRKKSKKENGSASQTSGSDTSKDDTRQSLFLEEFEVHECHDTDTVDLSDHEDVANISKNIGPENTSTPKKDESIKKSKKASKSPKLSKKSKKNKSEKKKKTEEAKAEKKREKEEKMKKDKTEKVEKASLKKKNDSVNDKGPVLDADQSLVPLDVHTSQMQLASADVGSNHTDKETIDGVTATEGSFAVEIEESKEESQSLPSSPRSDDDGTPQRVSLGPRLKTAILQKVSNGKESESSRVTLTRPKTVEIPNPPPRKHRKRPISQNADTSEVNQSDTSVSTLEQSAAINECATVETSSRLVEDYISDVSSKKQIDTKQGENTELQTSAKIVISETKEVIKESAQESPMKHKEHEEMQTGLVTEPLNFVEVEDKVPLSKATISNEVNTEQEKEPDSIISLPRDELTEAPIATKDQNEVMRPEDDSRYQNETARNQQIESVHISTDKESHVANSDFVSATTIDLVLSSPVARKSKEEQNRKLEDERMRAIAKTHTELVVNGAVESLKSEAVEKQKCCFVETTDGSLKEECYSSSLEVIAVNKYSIETGEKCTVITVGSKSEIDELKTVDKGPDQPLNLQNTLDISHTQPEVESSGDEASTSGEVETTAIGFSLSYDTNNTNVNGESNIDIATPEDKYEHELNSSAKNIADSNDSAIDESSDICQDSSISEGQHAIKDDSNVYADKSYVQNNTNVYTELRSAVHESNEHAMQSSTDNDSDVSTENACNKNYSKVSTENPCNLSDTQLSTEKETENVINICTEHTLTENEITDNAKHSSRESDSKVSVEQNSTENDGYSLLDSKCNGETRDSNVDSRDECLKNGDSEESEETQSEEEVQMVMETITIIQMREVHSVTSPFKEANNNKVLSLANKDKDERMEDTAFKTEVHMVLEGDSEPGVE